MKLLYDAPQVDSRAEFFKCVAPCSYSQRSAAGGGSCARSLRDRAPPSARYVYGDEFREVGRALHPACVVCAFRCHASTIDVWTCFRPD